MKDGEDDTTTVVKAANSSVSSVVVSCNSLHARAVRSIVNPTCTVRVKEEVQNLYVEIQVLF